jgi:hypothetical protein
MDGTHIGENWKTHKLEVILSIYFCIWQINQFILNFNKIDIFWENIPKFSVQL